MDHAAYHPSRDEIDLTRLLRRLDASIHEPGWDDPFSYNTWIKAQKTLQKAKHGRTLVRNVYIYREEQTQETTERINDAHAKLAQIEEFAKEVSERTAPKPTRPAPILPTIPRPPPPSSTSDVPPYESPITPPIQDNSPSVAPIIDDLLLPADIPARPLSTPMTLIPPTLPTTNTSTTTAVAPRYLQSSTALQQELSEQLVQMAAQLKRNARYFSETLSKDQAVVEEAQQKLEGNYDVMKKERVRLRDLRGKIGSTTCLVFLIIVAVIVLFVLMIYLIRFT